MKSRWAGVAAIVVVMGSSIACFGADEACVVPVGAAAGDLSLEGCIYTGADGIEYPADCGTLIVPENRNDSDANLIALPVIRVRATGDHPSEPIFWLSGGPGSSNMVVGGLEVFLERHDAVMVGYRGVDGSVVLDCPEVAKVMKNSGGDLASEASLIRFGHAMARCAEAFQAEGVDIDGYNVSKWLRIWSRHVKRSVMGASTYSA